MAESPRPVEVRLPPIVVNPENGYYRIVDGRHRVVAAFMAGRDATAAHVEQTEPTCAQADGAATRAPTAHTG